MLRIFSLIALGLVAACSSLASSGFADHGGEEGKTTEGQAAYRAALAEAEEWLDCSDPSDELMRIHGQGAIHPDDPTPPQSPQEAADRLSRGWDEAISEPGPRYAGPPEEVASRRGIKFDHVLYSSEDAWLIGGSKGSLPKVVQEFGRLQDGWVVSGVRLTCHRRAS
jgi:hypothetical protein